MPVCLSRRDASMWYWELWDGVPAGTMVPAEGLEPPTRRLQNGSSTTELHRLGGQDGWTRTSDIWVPNPELYQLSYVLDLVERLGVEPSRPDSGTRFTAGPGVRPRLTLRFLWRAGKESNLDLRFWRPPFCQLNYPPIWCPAKDLNLHAVSGAGF